MNDWRQRARELSGKPTNQPVIDRQALAKRARESEALAAAAQEEQRKLRHRIAGVVASVLSELAATLGSEQPQPVVEEHHKRMSSVTAEIKSTPVVVNILSLPSGKTRLTCFIGVAGEASEREFEPAMEDEIIRTWVGEQVVSYLEQEAV